MKYIAIFLAAAGLLAGCSTTGSTDPASIDFKLPPGSTLVLNQPLEIPAGRAHLMLQNGAAGTAAGELEVGCRFEVRNLGPRTINPDTFVITEMASGREWVNQPSTMRFYKVLHLHSDTQADIMPMKCSYTDWPLMGKPVTVAEIQEALGSVFTFDFGKSAAP